MRSIWRVQCPGAVGASTWELMPPVLSALRVPAADNVGGGGAPRPSRADVCAGHTPSSEVTKSLGCHIVCRGSSRRAVGTNLGPGRESGTPGMTCEVGEVGREVRRTGSRRVRQGVAPGTDLVGNLTVLVTDQDGLRHGRADLVPRSERTSSPEQSGLREGGEVSPCARRGRVGRGPCRTRRSTPVAPWWVSPGGARDGHPLRRRRPGGGVRQAPPPGRSRC